MTSAGIPTNIFNTGNQAITVAVNRGTPLPIGMASPTNGFPAQAFPAPGWDIGGASPGNWGAGTNNVQVTTSGVTLPLLVLKVANVNPSSVQAYVIWFLDPGSLQATLSVVLLSAGEIIAVSTKTGVATMVASGAS